MWAPLLPTPVTQAMFWLETPPGLVEMLTVELWELGMEACHSVKVKVFSKQKLFTGVVYNYRLIFLIKKKNYATIPVFATDLEWDTFAV